MKLSIIVPVYNVELHIRRCLDSLVNQNLDSSSYEVIVINDGSEDSSLIIANEYVQNYPNFSIYDQKNKGLGATRNVGIDLAKGNYIYFLDSDDYLASNTLGAVLSFIDENSFDLLSFNSIGTTMSDLNKSCTENYKTLKVRRMDGFEYIETLGFKNEVWWYIVKRDFLNKFKIRFIEGRWMEDGPFTLKILLSSKNVVHLPIDVHRHVKTIGSAMTSNESEHCLKVIDDMEHAAKIYGNILENYKENSLMSGGCFKRLLSRQESYIFFMLVRVLKSNMSLVEINKLLSRLTKAQVYPMNSFIGVDYDGIKYKLLVSLFNYRLLYLIIFLIMSLFFRMRKIFQDGFNTFNNNNNL